MKHTFKDWFLATRPWSFPASAMPVLVTLFYLWWRGYELSWGFGIWAVLNVVIFHASGNTWSDYFDYKKGVDADDTYGNKTLTDGLFTSGQIRALALGLLIVGSVFGVTLICLTGWQLLFIGLGGLVCTLLYPFFKYRALGDVVIFMAYAFLPTIGTSYVAAGVIDWGVWVVGLPVGLITVSILHSNNLRDMQTDARAEISTFAALVGPKSSVVIYVLEVLLPFVSVAVSVALGWLPVAALLSLVALVSAWKACRVMLSYKSGGSDAIANLDQVSAQLQLVFSLLFSVGLVLGVLI